MDFDLKALENRQYLMKVLSELDDRMTKMEAKVAELEDWEDLPTNPMPQSIRTLLGDYEQDT